MHVHVHVHVHAHVHVHLQSIFQFVPRFGGGPWRGRGRSAAQAYAQAAALPGLSPALADYARERLNALQAGS